MTVVRPKVNSTPTATHAVDLKGTLWCCAHLGLDQQPAAIIRDLRRLPLTQQAPVRPDFFNFVVDVRPSTREYWVARRREVPAVSWTWVVLVGVTPSIASLCRDLVSLYRQAVRRASIEHIIQNRIGVIRIMDRTAEGDVLEIEVQPSVEQAPEPDLRSSRA